MVSEIRSPMQLPKGEKYDVLLITERHDLLNTLAWEKTSSLLRHYHDVMLSGNPKAKTYFYHSWLDVNKSDPQPWIAYEKSMLKTWECVSSKVNLGLEADGLPQSVQTIGAGWALANMVERAINGDVPGLDGGPRLVADLVFRDNVHLTDLGEFFIGAFTYAQLFDKNPKNTFIGTVLPNDTGKALLAMAWELHQEYKIMKNQGVQNMAACRTHIAKNVCGPLWTEIKNDPSKVASCKSMFGDENHKKNPFRWPDPNRMVWPSPK